MILRLRLSLRLIPLLAQRDKVEFIWIYEVRFKSSADIRPQGSRRIPIYHSCKTGKVWAFQGGRDVVQWGHVRTAGHVDMGHSRTAAVVVAAELCIIRSMRGVIFERGYLPCAERAQCQ